MHRGEYISRDICGVAKHSECVRRVRSVINDAKETTASLVLVSLHYEPTAFAVKGYPFICQQRVAW